MSERGLFGPVFVGIPQVAQHVHKLFARFCEGHKEIVQYSPYRILGQKSRVQAENLVFVFAESHWWRQSHIRIGVIHN
jgi:hypothetical protein